MKIKTDDYKRMTVSFSGGRTSAFMTKHVLDIYSKSHEIVVTFANTGLEHPATLDFVRDCDKNFGFNTVWLEGVVTHEHGVGMRHRVVNYETASRNGEPFADVVKKYGIPFNQSPFCTDRLKVDTMTAYLRSLGWKNKQYLTCVGIRADEIDRMASKKRGAQLFYPLIEWGVRKSTVLSWWAKQSFDLKLPGEHYGNCVGCWKKSDRKLFTLALEAPDMAFGFFDRMEKLYGQHERPEDRPGGQTFYRNYRSAQDMMKQAHSIKFTPYQDKELQIDMFDPELDKQAACGESCEVYADE